MFFNLENRGDFMFKKIFLFVIFSTFSVFTNNSFFSKLEETTTYLKSRIKTPPELLIVLTAGIEGLEEVLQDKVVISNKDILHFPKAMAKGHSGELIFGTFEGHGIVLMKGRYHYYEDLEPQDVVFPYFVLKNLGVKNVIITSAVGGIRYDLNPGDIVLLKDHINFMNNNPLKGIAMYYPNQFTDMTNAYDSELSKIAIEEANKLNYTLKEGVCIDTMGPNYETKSEIKMFRSFGADVVGMSTVFEVLAFNFLEIKVLAFCCVSNPAADRHEGILSHAEVLYEMNQMGPRLKHLLESCMKRICNK